MYTFMYIQFPSRHVNAVDSRNHIWDLCPQEHSPQTSWDNAQSPQAKRTLWMKDWNSFLSVLLSPSEYWFSWEHKVQFHTRHYGCEFFPPDPSSFSRKMNNTIHTIAETQQGWKIKNLIQKDESSCNGFSSGSMLAFTFWHYSYQVRGVVRKAHVLYFCFLPRRGYQITFKPKK